MSAPVHIHISDATLLRRLQQHHADDIRVLSRCAGVRLSGEPLTACAAPLIAQSTAGPLCTFGIEMIGVAATAAATGSPATVNERKRDRLEQDLQRLERTVANEGFRRAASERVQRQHDEKVRAHMVFLNVYCIVNRIFSPLPRTRSDRAHPIGIADHCANGIVCELYEIVNNMSVNGTWNSERSLSSEPICKVHRNSLNRE